MGELMNSQCNKSELLNFETNAAAENSEDDYSQLSLADRALKRHRLDQQESATYMDTRFLQPTSNMVERLNS